MTSLRINLKLSSRWQLCC